MFKNVVILMSCKFTPLASGIWHTDYLDGRNSISDVSAITVPNRFLKYLNFMEQL